MMTFPISGKTKFMFQTNSQSSYLWAWTSTIFERTNLCHAGHTAVHAIMRGVAAEPVSTGPISAAQKCGFEEDFGTDLDVHFIISAVFY
jgi:hypothetical protein